MLILITVTLIVYINRRELNPKSVIRNPKSKW